MNIRLVKPTLEYEEKVLEYKKEFIDNGETHIHGSHRLNEVETYNEWLSLCKELVDNKEVTDKSVPGEEYLVIDIDNNNLVGLVNLRHCLNDYLFKYGGHIGYSIKPSERRKGYATLMLSLTLDKCKELNIDKVLITCDKTNIGSSKVIENNGFILEDEIANGDVIYKRFWKKL